MCLSLFFPSERVVDITAQLNLGFQILEIGTEFGLLLVDSIDGVLLDRHLNFQNSDSKF